MEAQFERISKLALGGTFGPGKFLQVIPNPDAVTAPQYASQLGFLTVELEVDSKIVRKPIVVKIQPKEQAERAMMNSDNQFFVEVTMYTEVLPFLGALEMDVFPSFIFGEASKGSDPDSDIVIMEDMSDQGYITAPDIFLDADTIKLTMRRLGEFHGYSYRAKRTRMSQTQALGRTLPMKFYKMDEDDDMSRPCWDRAFNAAKKKCESPVILEKVREKMDKYGPAGMWDCMRKPREPFAVIIHGDFNRNNLMFKYVNKKATKVKFLDLQTSLYSDPSVDIAFFLYMNSTQETRNDHWDEFFTTYWEGLTSIEPEPGFTYEEFLKNFASGAFFGYLPCSFFLPIMLDPQKPEIAEYFSLSREEKLHKMITAGGEAGDKAVADIVLDLLNRGFLEEFLINFK